MDPIKHVVLLILENHSFDQMLGDLRKVFSVLDGVDPVHPQSNSDGSGRAFRQVPMTELQMSYDPMHEIENAASQMNGGKMDGFVKDFASAYRLSSAEDRQEIMGYYPLGFLPALHTLAQQFAICDHWFSSLPGPTWPNRFFALSGTSSGQVRMPNGLKDYLRAQTYFESQTQATLFDRLNEAGKSWKIYYYDMPSSLVLVNQRKAENLARYEPIDHFFEQVQKPEVEFPEFTFLEPKYFGADQNDDHPPHNVMKAEKLVADVYNALRANTNLWMSTLLIVIYDEHGGFYDHVPPPATIPPDDKTQNFPFDRLGVRVPALLVSPWVKKGIVNTLFDHTSLLKYLTEKWNLGPLGRRTAQANSIREGLQFDQPLENTMPFIRVPDKMLIARWPNKERANTSDHQMALHMFSDYLSRQTDSVTTSAIEGIGLSSRILVLARSIFARATATVAEGVSWVGRRPHERRMRRTEVAMRTFIDSRGKTTP
jgi:phospholipase C